MPLADFTVEVLLESWLEIKWQSQRRRANSKVSPALAHIFWPANTADSDCRLVYFFWLYSFFFYVRPSLVEQQQKAKAHT